MSGNRHGKNKRTKANQKQKNTQPMRPTPFSTFKRRTQSSTGDNLLADEMDGLNIEDMTSRELSTDIYASHATHEYLLKDRVQVMIYRDVICDNKHLFRNKIVLNVNCGLGILALYAAKIGAKHVYAIDTSSIVQLTKQIVIDNKFGDVITVIQGTVKDIQLPVNQVDVIVTIFRGQLNLYDESVLSILDARDKWLCPGGLIFPDSCTMNIGAIDDVRYHNSICHFWMNVYDFKMHPIQRDILTEPFQTRIVPKQIASNTCKLNTIDFHTVTRESLQTYESVFRLRMQQPTTLSALFIYFDIHFNNCHLPTVLSTAPYLSPIYWKQTVFLLPDPSIYCVGEDELLYGVFRLVSHARNINKHELLLDLCIRGRQASFKERMTYRWR